MAGLGDEEKVLFWNGEFIAAIESFGTLTLIIRIYVINKCNK